LIQIGRNDLFWNYGATFLKIASSVILLPLILVKLSTELVGIWTIFMTVTAFSTLIDFGFGPSFTRNVAYVFSGVKKLQNTGFEIVNSEFVTIDFGLLKSLINSMKWLYKRLASVLFIFLISIGTYYIYILTKNYTGSKSDIYISWFILCIINTYNVYTLYYDALLQGKGLIKRSKQIIILGNITYLSLAFILLQSGFGLISIVSAQASSVIVIRWLSYRAFFSEEIKNKLQNISPWNKKEVLKAIYPNAIKIGLTSIGGFLVNRSAMIIGSLYLSLSEIASYGISIQIIGVIYGIAGIYTSTYQPRIVFLRIKNNIPEIKKLYIKGQLVLISTYLLSGLVLITLGNDILTLLGSKTLFINKLLLFIIIIINFLENNHSMAGSILLTRNEVPFFKASLTFGFLTVLLLIFFLNYTKMGLWSLILAPGISQGIYQNWKWPLEVVKELKISLNDYIQYLHFSKLKEF